ncbi:hypothetical protein [Aeromonas caviae]|uniref:hypothetical protein n=1 Tax=Aeromonas caviae TaxID=648 RepID=UPI002B483FCA|nr:hypothetical protein [Aeromonas caviae]
MICVELTSEGFLKQAPPETCSYVLLTIQEHTKLTDISNWFQFDIADVGIAFSSGIVIWALGLKLGAIARIIVGAKRG